MRRRSPRSGGSSPFARRPLIAGQFYRPNGGQAAPYMPTGTGALRLNVTEADMQRIPWQLSGPGKLNDKEDIYAMLFHVGQQVLIPTLYTPEEYAEKQFEHYRKDIQEQSDFVRKAYNTAEATEAAGTGT